MIDIQIKVKADLRQVLRIILSICIILAQ